MRALYGVAVLGFWLVGCAGSGGLSVLPEARQQLQRVQGDAATLASAGKDVQRAAESLARAERLRDYWGSAADAEHYAGLSLRYGQIAEQRRLLADQQQQLAALQGERERLQLLNALRQQARSHALADEAGALLPSLAQMHFDSDSSELDAAASRVLLTLAQYLKHNPQRRVRVEGYSDNHGTDQDNRALSRARAEAVAGVLRDLGVAAGRIELRAHGAAFPLAENASSVGRARNRRVEVLISDELGQLGGER